MRGGWGSVGGWSDTGGFCYWEFHVLGFLLLGLLLRERFCWGFCCWEFRCLEICCWGFASKVTDQLSGDSCQKSKVGSRDGANDRRAKVEALRH